MLSVIWQAAIFGETYRQAVLFHTYVHADTGRARCIDSAVAVLRAPVDDANAMDLWTGRMPEPALPELIAAVLSAGPLGVARKSC